MKPFFSILGGLLCFGLALSSFFLHTGNMFLYAFLGLALLVDTALGFQLVGTKALSRILQTSILSIILLLIFFKFGFVGVIISITFCLLFSNKEHTWEEKPTVPKNVVSITSDH